MDRIDFRNKRQKEKFDSYIFNSSDGFIQQTTRWAEIASPISGDMPVFLYEENKDYFIGCSLYLFNSRLGNILVSNIQAGSMGCITYKGEDKYKNTAYEKLMEAIIFTARSNNCISITLTSNPFANDGNIIEKYLKPEAGMKSFISIIKTKKFFNADGEVTLKKYNRSSNLSRNLKKAYHNSLEFYVEKKPQIFDEWYNNIHKERIYEIGGKPLPYKMLYDILFHPKMEEFSKLFTIYKNGILIGADLCVFNDNGIFDNFMPSTRKQYLDIGTNFFMIEQILKWCYRNQIKIYNWQSSNPPKGGVFKFKQQWGSEVLPYNYYTKIIDRERFEEVIRNKSLNTIRQVFEGHFFAPFHTVKKGIYGLKSKEEINRIVES
ncbi:MAG: hypothetical protein ACOCQ4_00210 [bacterium]